MAIAVECGCGARFKVKDELAGRRGKCPKCGGVLMIEAAAIPAEPAYDMDDAPPERSAPAAKPQAAATAVAQARPAKSPAMGIPRGRRLQPKQAPTRFAISGKMIMLIAAFIVIPTVIWIVKAGPVHARDQWQAIGPQADDDIKDVVNKALADQENAGLKSLAESLGDGADVSKFRPKYTPTVGTLLVDAPTIMWSVPEKVPFQARIGQYLAVGISAAGKPQLMNVHGFYYTKTRRVEAEVEMNGTPIKVMGRVVDKTVVMD